MTRKLGGGHLISIHDLTADEVDRVVSLGADIKANPKAYRKALDGKSLAMIFMKSSTRTRVSFEVGTAQLGGTALFLSSRDIQIGRGEPIRDTAQVLSRYVDGIMARTFAHSDVTQLAEHGTVPVINGLTDLLHPCQVLADLLTMRECLGDLKGKTLAYVGDGNNMAHSLMFAASKAGMDFVCVAPEGYWMDRDVVALGEADAKAAGTKLVESKDMSAAEGAHVITTDTWVSMGQEDEKTARLAAFDGYMVDDAVMEAAADGAIFMHCLPAYRGYEVSESVCDGPQSVIYDEAENRLHAQKAVLFELMAE